ncbi:protein kinase domain-containing protein [Actinomadura yumaensis]|uniref:PQQ-binding-like beta-propeller repeat protein n=1 Tax=Actinomadura yumaensis TaxID=111807 RepID=A0ABW2CQC6_9ACTN
MGTWLKNLDAQDPPRVGPYRLLAVLGSGGMGHVYLGRSPGRRAAAVKVVRPELSGDQVFRTRFQREVEAARTVGGAFTSPVLASDTEGDPPWLATAYIAGPPLNEAVRRHGPLEEPAVRALGAALAEALTAIHEAGLVHRDLKPANVLLAQDGPRVIDFGISRTSDGTTITRSGALVGSPAFMAPEQVASGRRAGPEADVFALGGTLVYAATGARPFDAGTVPAMLARIVHGEPLLDGFPAALLSTVAECLDKDPDRRPSPPDLVERLGGTEPRGWWPPPVREEITARTHEVAALLAAPPERETGPHPPKNDPPVDGAERPKDEAGTESKEPARHSRRGFLAATGAAGAVAAAGAVVWFVRDRVTRDSPSADPSEDRRPLWTYTPHLETTDPQAKGLVVLRTAAHENTVVLGEAAKLTCLDASTGARRWSVRAVSPALAAVHISGDAVYAWGDSTLGHGAIAAYDLGDGERRWRIGENELPAGYRGRVSGIDGSTLFTVGTEVVRDQTPSRSSTKSMYDVYALALPSRRIRWRYRVPRPGYPGAPIILGAGCCLASVGGTVDAIDAVTGKRRWQAPLDPYFDDAVRTSGSLVLVPGFGTLTALAADTGARLWKADGFSREGPGVLAATPQVVCIGDGKTAYGLDARTGAVRWRTRLPAPPTPSAPPWPRTLIAMALSPGLVARTVGMPGLTVDLAGPAGLAGRRENAGLAVLNPADGRPHWILGAPGNTRTPWTVRADEARVYAFDGERLLAFGR